jgi:hypothetical protein
VKLGSLVARFPFKGLILSAGMLLAAATSLGMGDPSFGCGHCGRTSLGVEFTRAFTNDDGVVNDRSRDPGDNGVDPGNGKAVGRCLAGVVGPGTIQVTIENGYPGYTCRVWVKIRNAGCKQVRRQSVAITAPPELAVTEVSRRPCYVLQPGDQRFEGYDVQVLQSAEEAATYQFVIRTTFRKALSGCSGCR